MNENIYYTIEPYDDKKIYINDVDSEELLHIELLDCIIVPEISFIDSYKYNVEDDVIDGKECYKISIYNNKENYEYNCWISKENGLVLKEYMRTYWDLIESEEKEENIEETKINYYFDVVTDDDVKKIDFSEYSDYEIVDNTK
jgi:folate-dependent tRNA-U54 methylase TrmFO/GidA